MYIDKRRGTRSRACKENTTKPAIRKIRYETTLATVNKTENLKCTTLYKDELNKCLIHKVLRHFITRSCVSIASAQMGRDRIASLEFSQAHAAFASMNEARRITNEGLKKIASHCVHIP